MRYKFAAVINCMDGRAQKPVIGYLERKLKVDHVDMITEAGPDKILSAKKNTLVKSIEKE